MELKLPRMFSENEKSVLKSLDGWMDELNELIIE